MNPKHQLFNKEELAKFQNCYQEVFDGRKLVIGPHIVARGNQKNYAQFINYNEIKKPDSIYFEDTIAKAIMFRSAEKIYGIKPNSIGDMRFITVPYSIALLGFLSSYKLDLYKIWKNQSISTQLADVLYNLMVQVETFIKSNAPGSLYGEWAKKEDCWNELKESKFKIDFEKINDDFVGKKTNYQRKRITDEETALQIIQDELDKINSIPPAIWHKIEQWGKSTMNLTPLQCSIAFNLAGRVRNKSKIGDSERTSGIKIIDTVIDKASDLLFQIDELEREQTIPDNPVKQEITMELINKMIAWDKKNKKLKPHHFIFMNEVSTGKYPLNERAKKYAELNLAYLSKFGFVPYSNLY